MCVSKLMGKLMGVKEKQGARPRVYWLSGGGGGRHFCYLGHSASHELGALAGTDGRFRPDLASRSKHCWTAFGLKVDHGFGPVWNGLMRVRLSAGGGSCPKKWVRYGLMWLGMLLLTPTIQLWMTGIRPPQIKTAINAPISKSDWRFGPKNTSPAICFR